MIVFNYLVFHLAWTWVIGSNVGLYVVFGMIGSRVSKWRRFGRRLLIAILANHAGASVCLPSAAIWFSNTRQEFRCDPPPHHNGPMVFFRSFETISRVKWRQSDWKSFKAVGHSITMSPLFCLLCWWHHHNSCLTEVSRANPLVFHLKVEYK